MELARFHHSRRFHDQHLRCRRPHARKHQVLQVASRPSSPPAPSCHQAQSGPQDCRRRPPLVDPGDAQRGGRVPPVVLHVRDARHPALQGQALQLHGPPEHAVLRHRVHTLGQPLHSDDCHVWEAGCANNNRVRLPHPGARHLGPQVLLVRLLSPRSPNSIRDGNNGGLDGRHGGNNRYDGSWRDPHSKLPAACCVVQRAAHCGRGLRAAQPDCRFYHQQLQPHQEHHRGHSPFSHPRAAGVERDSQVDCAAQTDFAARGAPEPVSEIPLRYCQPSVL
mmetsp:Transcript_8879/g.23153  ORF Transcript_8879/g.23153 Transcript_8879/m.23153 type:complete len:278 (-) Transcript_8879:1355-2188(-)